MIKFFRKIRQNYLTEGKTGKYIKYAIGEILLVVLGILIALQINNWNQNRNFRIELNHIINEVRINLNQDILDLKTKITAIENYNKTIDNLINNGRDMPVDSLIKCISRVHQIFIFSAVDFGYNKLSNHSRTEFLPDPLTNKLTSYYSSFSDHARLNHSRFEILSVYSLNKFRDYFIEHGFPLEDKRMELVRLNDSSHVKKIITDIRFIGLLRSAKYNRQVELSSFMNASEQAAQNLELINKYLTGVED